VETHFGWNRANAIGATPQDNTPGTSWPDFFRTRRLGAQLALACARGHGRALERGTVLLEKMAGLFATPQPAASLLHGDLWSGNRAMDETGEPVLFDPAVYYGDRETDVAMTRLFGGFDPGFHEAYRASWPLEPGFEVRAELYNLYHVLNHLNLFGAGYLPQAQAMIDRLLAELR
jgi:fructosamine-3-kinase